MKNYVYEIFKRNEALADKTAIVDKDGQRSTSWSELCEKSRAVAAYALELGLKGLVPVCMPRCTETVEVLLGLGLAGLGVAPLSDRTPESRIAMIEEQSGNSVWTWEQYNAALERSVTTQNVTAERSATDQKVDAERSGAPLENAAERGAAAQKDDAERGETAQKAAPEAVEFGDEDAAYVVYTSGSTGVPKGVVLSNDTVEKSYIRMASSEFLDLKDGDVVLQNASFSFVALMIDLYAPLYKACVTHILPDEARTDIELMTAYIRKHGITSMFITPKPLQRLGDAPSLRVVCVGGERVSELGPKGYRLLNVWGMSETAALALGYNITEPMLKTPIGKSRGDFRCYVVDDNGRLADEGELCLSGATASRYYKRPDLTEKYFEPNPFCDDEGHRTLMHTGDIVRRLEDGNLMYINRKDYMIKINGQRVEPGEAEAVLECVPGIRSVAVKGFTEEDGHSYLCAYYVSDGELSEEYLHGELRKHLPEYMIPSFYVKLEAMPLNSNGKIDRRILAAPQLKQLHSEYVAAQNETEEALCRAFEQVLKTERVGIEDDFLRLGGDSIRAMSVVSLAELPGLNTAAVLKGRTPQRIAELVKEQAGQQTEDKLELNRELEKAPLTDSQLGIYLECSAVPESIKYNIPFSLSFERSSDMSAAQLAACVDRAIAMHPAMYARIAGEGESIYMYRCEMPAEGICSYEELGGSGAAAASGSAADEFAGEWDGFVRPFRLAEAPLCRAKLLMGSNEVHLLMDVHHIVFDGSSVAILVKQICQAICGEELAEEKIDAFALREALQQASEGRTAAARSHFETLLAGLELDSNLLPDRKSDDNNPPSEALEVEIADLDFGPLHEQGISESSFFMGVFGYTLAKMTGQLESLFEAVESGRRTAAFDSTVSMLVKTLPVYMRIDEKRSAYEQLAELQQQFYASIDSDCVSLIELSEEYGINSNVMFVYQSDMFSDYETSFGRVAIEIPHTGSAIANFTASVIKNENSHNIILEYRSDLYDRETIVRFGELFCRAARAFADDSSLESIQLLNESDREFLDRLNSTESPYNTEETIIDIFNRFAAQQPDKELIVIDDRKYSYSEAADISDRIAAYVSGLGIGRGQAVAVLIPRNEYMLLASLGIMKAGAIYVPLDPSYPTDRLSFIQRDTDSRLLIADRSLLHKLPDYDGELLYTDEIPELPAAESLPEPPGMKDGFVLLYTSGTTGTPKGCLLMHENLSAFVHAYAELTEMDENSRASAYASYGFDAHMADLYPIITRGGTLVIVPDSIRLDLKAVKDYCEANRVTHIVMTTQLCVQFVMQFRELKHLKCMLAGGEKMVSLEPPLNYKLINAYGPTECTVMETYFTVDRRYEDIPIGKAIANTRLYIVDPVGRRVPVGVPGELIIAGPQVACEYIHRPEQTALAFVTNSFEAAVEPGYERSYRTGDIVRYLPDGNIVFIGRRDMQVKIRGFRIELSEVERVIMDFPSVKNATVIACDSPAGGKCLNAYLVGDEKIDIEAMNDYIRSVKPAYMVPAASMQIDEIPLTVNGKVDKRRLPKIEIKIDATEKPENELEQRIFDRVCEALGTDAFGINTDLFDVGLSSISSIRLCTLLAEEFDIVVQIRDIKKNPTVAELESFVLKSKSEGSAAEPAAADKEAEPRFGEDHPISKTMEGIFIECMGKPDSSFYNIPYLLKLSAGNSENASGQPDTSGSALATRETAIAIDEERLKTAIVAAVEAHPYMKAEIFTDSEGTIRQHRRLGDEFGIEEIKLLEAGSIEELKSTLVQPFKLMGGRLFEITLIHADGLYLFLNFHHIIADGTSINIFMRDIERAYAGEKLEEERYSGFELAELEQRARTAENIAEAGQYYEELLGGLDKEFIPLPDRYQSAEKSSGRLVLHQSSADPEKIKSFCESRQLGMNAFFVSVFGFVLSRYAASEYSVFNTVYNGRNDSRAADSFAMLVKTLPVVFNSDTDSCSEAVAAMGRQLFDSMSNDLYSYGEIVRALDVNSDVIFIYQGEDFVRRSFCGVEIEEIGLQLSEAKAALAMQVILRDGELIYDLEYDAERFSEQLMRALVSAFDVACLEFAEDKKLSEVSLLSSEAEAELEHYNDTEYEYDREQTITELFLDRVAQRPEQLCVSYKNMKLSYAEVGELSGRLAGFLMSKGIGAGDIVAILINRNENMVITAHGAIRTGAAYLGLDPSYPADRLEFMLEDSGAGYLVAERELMEKLPNYKGPVIYTDEIKSLKELSAESEREFRSMDRHRITAENDALIIYSSGTTGTPKGSVLQHKAIVCFYHNYTQDVEMSWDSNVATYASFGFDGGAQDVLCAPMSGASLFVVPDEIRMDIRGLEQFYIHHSISSGFITTQVGTMFISETTCRTLRHFIVGGEKLIPVLAPDWLKFHNGYGPSESMCYVNLHWIKDKDRLQPIGRVNRNIKEYIIDKFGNRLPFGACGELCISGGQLGRGYLNRPEKTAQAFVDNPFSDKAGYTRMYRSGDIVRMLPDGNYDFVGRKDGQVKIRGFRVELSEVELQIRSFPGVEKAVLTALDNPAGGKYLAAYVVAEDELDISALKTFIAAEKPDYMVPSVIMQIDDIPLTSNGKTDFRRLPKAELGAGRVGAEPSNETEKRICDIFAEVLGLNRVYADDDFFEIGGSSISAIQVLVKCEQAGMELVYKNLFANPTAQKLNALLNGREEKDIIASDLEKGDGHDYSALKYNVLEKLPEISYEGVGDVLLTGATGFLGSHVFRELLSNTDGSVICIVRSKPGISAQDRLEMMMVYYFEDWYSDELSNRVTVIDGDIEDAGIGDKLRALSFDTIINCAANVKHFAAGDALIGSNFTGVENLISIAEEKGAKLIQISSLSVCGESVNGSVPAGYRFRESDLNIGQSLENKYIYSKYLAEQAVIDAVSRKRIRGKIIRLGNLMARSDDSEFQVNAATNGFLRLFLGFSSLGCFPVDMMDAEIEFSPIDSVAKAVVLLSGTPDEFTVFHAKNCNIIQYGYFLSAIREQAGNIELVENDEFEARLNKALEDESRVELLGGLLAYKNGFDASLADTIKFSDEGDEGREIRVKLGSDTTFTTKALYRLGFAWPLISKDYLDRMVEALLEMNLFNK